MTQRMGENTMSYRAALSLCLSAALSTAVGAQDLPKTQVKVIGLNSPTPVSIYDEVPFWRKTT
jgi:TRAP-type transport system periplasmic protein